MIIRTAKPVRKDAGEEPAFDGINTAPLANTNTLMEALRTIDPDELERLATAAAAAAPTPAPIGDPSKKRTPSLMPDAGERTLMITDTSLRMLDPGFAALRDALKTKDLGCRRCHRQRDVRIMMDTLAPSSRRNQATFVIGCAACKLFARRPVDVVSISRAEPTAFVARILSELMHAWKDTGWTRWQEREDSSIRAVRLPPTRWKQIYDLLNMRHGPLASSRAIALSINHIAIFNDAHAPDPMSESFHTVEGLYDAINAFAYSCPHCGAATLFNCRIGCSRPRTMTEALLIWRDA